MHQKRHHYGFYGIHLSIYLLLDLVYNHKLLILHEPYECHHMGLQFSLVADPFEDLQYNHLHYIYILHQKHQFLTYDLHLCLILSFLILLLIILYKFPILFAFFGWDSLKIFHLHYKLYNFF